MRFYGAIILNISFKGIFWSVNVSFQIMIVDVRVNVTVGSHEERMMISGIHTVADVFCCCCGQLVGWKYVGFLHILLSISL